MRLPKRFGLSTLLLLMLAAASVFGFLAWRKSQLKAEVARINEEGIGHVTLSDSWLFPVLKQGAYLRLVKDIKGRLYVGDRNESVDAIASKFDETARRIKGLGVEKVQILLEEERPSQGQIVNVHVVINVDDVKGAVKLIAERSAPAN